ncbi:hypothetical protein [Enterovirga sp.]|uniref:hypothetical protein n=1 Tax=Enterovirga sp. TaxID=2026350 RepID=UPI002C99ACAC|nr:hypothetical protein [Enterovirga sp.]HMO30400.1 hypothetical protein [Enterovirga sp.]
MASYLEDLPPELQREIALKRRITPAEYAALLGLSLDAARRRWRKGAIPAPTSTGGRKLGIQLGVALEVAGRGA